MKRRASILSATAVALCLSGGAAAQTLEQAFASAYASNPALISARAGLRVVDENVPIARAGKLPDVDATASVAASRTGINGTPRGSSTEPRSLALNGTQVLYDGGRTRNSIDAAISGVDAARARLSDTEQNVLFQVVTSYMNVLRDQQFVDLAENNVSVIGEQLRAAEDRFEVGEVTRTDVSQARAALAQSRAALAAQNGALSLSYQAYRRVVGAAPGDLEQPPAHPTLPATLAGAVQEALDNHPQVLAARFDEEQSRSDVATAKGVLLPTVSLSGSVSYGEDQSVQLPNGTTAAQVQATISIPLYQGGAAYAGVRQAQETRSQRLSQIHETTRLIQETVENAWTNLETARISIQAGQEQVSAAQLAFEGVREEAKLGARTTLDVLDAEQDLLNARTDLVASMRDEYVAAYSVLSAVGRLTVNHLGVPVAPYEPDENYEQVNDQLFGFKEDELSEWKTLMSP